MPDPIRINALPVATALAETDNLVADRASGTGRATLAEVRTVLEGGGALAHLPSETRVADFDELDTLDAWHFETSGDAAAQHGSGAAALGFPSSGVLLLNCGTASARAQAWRYATGLVLDPTTPIVVEYRMRPITAGVYNDTERSWWAGIADAAADDAVALVALWDDGTSARTYALATVIGGAPADVVAVTLPALGAGQAAYRLRLSVTPTGATLECAIDDGAWTTLATSTQAPTETTYHPYLETAPEGGTGDGALIVDYVRWSAARLAESAGVTPPAFESVDDGGDVVGPAGATDNAIARFDTTTGKLLQNCGVTIDDDEHVAGVASIRLAEQASAPAATASAGALYTKDVGDATHLFYRPDVGAEVPITEAGRVVHGVQGGGTQHSEATTSSAGFMATKYVDLLEDRNGAADWFEEFENAIAASPYVATSSGAGATAINPSSPPAAPYFGIVYMGTGTTATGRVCLNSVRGLVVPSNGPIRFSGRLYVPALADVTEDYEISFGLTNNTISPDPTVGVWFAYDRAGSGANWRARTNRSAVATDTDTGVPVAVGWVKLMFEFDRAAGTVDYYIDGVQVATVTTTLPNLSDSLMPTPAIYKTAGTTDRGMFIDYTRLRAEMTR